MPVELSPSLSRLVELLNDQVVHDGSFLGDALQVSRAAVWKMIQKLKGHGIAIETQKGKGYRLVEPLILLSSEKIKSFLSPSNTPDSWEGNCQQTLVVLEKISSTNEYWKLSSRPPEGGLQVCVAEQQTAGRGRLARHWHSPFGQNLYISLSTLFERDISELSGLSLVMALAVCQALEWNCPLLPKLQVKWPNDILVEGRKLSGNLISIQAEPHGFSRLIIGVGINVNMQVANFQEIDQPWTSLRQLTGAYQDRNLLCASVIETMRVYLSRFHRESLKGFQSEWKERDALRGKPLCFLLHEKERIQGVGRGINEQGHLLVELDHGEQRSFASGEVSLRNR